MSEPGNWIFTILERQGEQFKSRYEGDNRVQEVNGTIKDGRLHWLSRDVKVIAGRPGHDNEGEIKGDEIAMYYSDPGGGPIRGYFKLRLQSRASGTRLAGVPAGPASAFRSLFNGKDLTGWNGLNGTLKYWKVKDQSLVFEGGPEPEAATDLLTDRVVSDFVLRLEFQAGKGTDTGVMLAALDPDGTIGMCTEVDIHHTPDPGEPDDRVGEIWTWGERVETDCLSRETVDLKGDDSWVAMEIERREGLLSLTVNGRELTNRLKVSPSPSRIGFQGEKGIVRFRKIEIKELNKTSGSPVVAADRAKPGAVASSSPTTLATAQRGRTRTPRSRPRSRRSTMSDFSTACTALTRTGTGHTHGSSAESTMTFTAKPSAGSSATGLKAEARSCSRSIGPVTHTAFRSG